MSFSGSIIIVNFNSGECLTRCLESIEQHAPAANVIVIDNASTDESANSPAVRRSGVTVQVNSRNVGFARAVNQGLAAASCELVLVLNPDCYLLPGAPDQLEEELRRHPECAIAGPGILNDDRSVQGSARGDPTLFTGLFGRSSLLTRLLPNSRLARSNIRTDPERLRAGESFVVDWVSGACMMARRKTLAEVGAFDERYFMYWEDADLCRRLRNQGHTIRYVPSCTIVHSGGVSSRGARTLAITAFHQSAYTYYATHVAGTAASRGLAWTLLKLRCRLKLLGGAHGGTALLP
jgi:N-acetylglucosaminyl-diphospho-decaprenol L-rhamnosyltransferase